jgi:O-antigen/teichoic acid export membrane protein
MVKRINKEHFATIIFALILIPIYFFISKTEAVVLICLFAFWKLIIYVIEKKKKLTYLQKMIIAYSISLPTFSFFMPVRDLMMILLVSLIVSLLRLLGSKPTKG